MVDVDSLLKKANKIIALALDLLFRHPGRP